MLHVSGEILDFSLSVEKYFTRLLHSFVKYYVFKIIMRREILYLEATMSFSFYYVKFSGIPSGRILLLSFCYPHSHV